MIQKSKPCKAASVLLTLNIEKQNINIPKHKVNMWCFLKHLCLHRQLPMFQHASTVKWEIIVPTTQYQKWYKARYFLVTSVRGLSIIAATLWTDVDNGSSVALLVVISSPEESSRPYNNSAHICEAECWNLSSRNIPSQSNLMQRSTSLNPSTVHNVGLLTLVWLIRLHV